MNYIPEDNTRINPCDNYFNQHKSGDVSKDDDSIKQSITLVRMHFKKMIKLMAI